MKPSLITFESAFLMIDTQEILIDALSDPEPFLLSMNLLQKSAYELEVPVVQTLQLSSKLGPMPAVFENSASTCFDKTSFSALGDAKIRHFIENHPAKQWVIAGLETHICVLQSAKELARMGRQVVIAADACASLNIYDYAGALSELRAEGIRVTTVQTIVYEWLKGADHPSFPTILKWVKQQMQGFVTDSGSQGGSCCGGKCSCRDVSDDDGSCCGGECSCNKP